MVVKKSLSKAFPCDFCRVPTLQELPYPADAGSTCEAWDAKNHPDCKGDKPAAWCKKARWVWMVGLEDVMYFFAIFWGMLGLLEPFFGEFFW